jgi:hypothetical protein
MFVNKAIIKIFLPRGHGLTKTWRNLHSEELSNLYYSRNIAGTNKNGMRVAKHLTRIGQLKTAYKFWARKPQ